jgi:hypothetical protein
MNIKGLRNIEIYNNKNTMFSKSVAFCTLFLISQMSFKVEG